MKISTLLIFISAFSLSAESGYSQDKDISLKLSNVYTIENVISEIEKTTDYVFIYNEDVVPTLKKEAKVDMSDQSLDEILNQLIRGTDLAYSLSSKQVTLYKDASKKVYAQIVSSAPLVVQQPSGKTITGRVTDTYGEPLPGVTVVVKGTTKGTTTDVDGNFSLTDVPENATLQFSFVGMKSQEIPIGNQIRFNVMMKEEAIGLDEIVAIGYGTMRKSDLTGSVSSVKSEDINAFPTYNVLQAMQGRSSGVHVKQNSGSPGGFVSVRIRGTNSIQGDNEPLYVIDGFPSSDSSPTVLDNTNIESIEILKDASAVAIYGSRGANGVVLITTKKGKEGKTQVTYDGSLGYQSLRKKFKLMNATEYANFYNLQRKNDGLSPYFSEEEISNFGEGFDWQDFVFKTAPVQSHALTISGGDEKTKFNISGNIFDQKGIIEGSGYKRYSLTANIQHKISEKITIDYSSILTQNTYDYKNWGGARAGSSLISVPLCAPPTLTPYNEDGSYRVLNTEYPFLSEGLVNPLHYINDRIDVTKTNSVLANLSFTYKPIEELTIKTYGGVENNDGRNDMYRSLNYIRSDGNATVVTTQFKSLLNESTINYNKIFNDKHNFSALAGFTYQDFISTRLSGSGEGFLSDITETADLGSASIPGIPQTGYSKSVIMSYLGRLNYIFDNRYLFTVSFRSDGSSKYSEGNKWGYFPSGAIAWRIKEEDFMKNAENISDLKLRASYGVTGSEAISPYATINNLSSGKTVFGDALYTFFQPGSLPKDLKWETTSQFDVGIDLGLMNNRYRFTADYYSKTTSDLLNSVQLPSSSGYTSTIKNVGEIRNNGLELTFDARVLNGIFTWDLNGNISSNKSKVKKLYGGEDIVGGWVDMTVVADYLNLLREGEPMGIFYGYLKDGYDEDGFEKYKDLNSDGIIDKNDKTKIGDPNPDFIYGLNSVMNFKNFELSLFFQGSHGNDLINISSVDNSINYGYGTNMYKEVYYNHWTPENPDAKYPKITRKQNYRFSDRLVEDGSYLRLRNIQLAYDFPVDKWNLNFLQDVRIYVSAQNLWTITDYSGWDPDVNSEGGSSSFAQGIDHYSYPTAKSFTFGISVKF